MLEARGAALALALALGLAPGAGFAQRAGGTEILADERGAIGLLSRPPAPPGPPERLGAVVVVHDALGHDRRSEMYAQQLLGASLVVLEIELQAFSDDGGTQVPAEPDRLRRALAALAADPAVERTRIAGLGFGAGARALVLEEHAVPLAAAVLLYPGCGTLAAALAQTDRPQGRASGAVLLMHGAADRANAAEDCAQLAGLLAEDAAEVRMITWPGARYGWDVPQREAGDISWHPAPGDGAPVAVQSWPELTELSANRTAAFLHAVLARGRP